MSAPILVPPPLPASLEPVVESLLADLLTLPFDYQRDGLIRLAFDWLERLAPAEIDRFAQEYPQWARQGQYDRAAADHRRRRFIFHCYLDLLTYASLDLETGQPLWISPGIELPALYQNISGRPARVYIHPRRPAA